MKEPMAIYAEREPIFPRLGPETFSETRGNLHARKGALHRLQRNAPDCGSTSATRGEITPPLPITLIASSYQLLALIWRVLSSSAIREHLRKQLRFP